MAHARVVSLVALLFALLSACGGSATKPIVAPPVTTPESPAFTAGSRMAHFHSTRFSMSLPLPDGSHWHIDDHHAPVLRATHAATGSLVELAIWHEDELVNRAKCEQHAHEKGLAKEAAGDEISTELAPVPPGWDTGIWIGADHDEKTATARFIAFGAFVHKCLYFRFETTTPLAAADVLSDRLAFVRVRVFGGLALDSFDVPRQAH